MSSLFKRIKKLLRFLLNIIILRKNKLNVYYFKNNKVLTTYHNHSFTVITNKNDYLLFCKKFNFTYSNFDRFDYNCFFACFLIKDSVASYGWISINAKKFPVDEILLKIDFPPNSAVLFDFKTEIPFRNLGYYSELILNFIKHFSNVKCFFIYTSFFNNYSTRGIIKAGFSLLGVYKLLSNRLQTDINIISL